jgi:ureidoglycolate hydrolase
MDRARTIPAEPLSPASFAPFGRVLEQPARAPDARGPGWSWWGETHLLPSDGRAFGVGMLALEPADDSFDWAERHLRSVEAILATDGDCRVYVAPAGPLELPGALERFRVFDLPQGRGVALDPGVWHGAPLAVRSSARAVVLLLEQTGATDTEVVRFPDSPITVRT